jgi:hypothetical protein
MLGLCYYYLAAGRATYFGYGSHPYAGQHALWEGFGALAADPGLPLGSMTATQSIGNASTPSLVLNGCFGSALDSWEAAQPVAADAAAAPPCCGGRSARISSASAATDNINKQFVALAPSTTYTLGERERGRTAVRTCHHASSRAAIGNPLVVDGGQ